MNRTATVNKIIPFSSVDGPGNRTAVFLQGCNFNCQYCHNPETINRCIHCGFCVRYCKTGALEIKDGRVQYDLSKCVMCDECFTHCRNGGSARVRELTAVQVMQEVKKQIPFIRGITVSGGECTLQRDFLVELLTLAKEAGLHTLIDSNGSYLFEADAELMAVTDGVMLDVKAWNGGEHYRVTGQLNDVVLKNLRWLAEQGKLTEVRTVVVPELFDCEETIRNVSALLRETDSLSTRYKIICYRPNGVRQQYRHLKSPSVDTLQSLADIAAEYGLKDVVII
ncbi:MAG: YjjW family glycine radical enzyme activase [Oscillospiraceae bacterium]|nr:YjjW family glycine radical enzyme activase [Oscillospiraceae bacterium]